MNLGVNISFRTLTTKQVRYMYMRDTYEILAKILRLRYATTGTSFLVRHISDVIIIKSFRSHSKMKSQCWKMRY